MMACFKCSESKPIMAKGMCAACYMRQRRRDRAGPAFVGRARTGSREEIALTHRYDWLDRFQGKIDASGGCHEWQGGSTAAGYGVFHACGYTYLAHRLAFALAGGKMHHPVVMHSCDNPKCVNPAHLVGGDYKANMADMVSKGRQNITEKCGAHLKDRAKHPRAKPVMTPKGEFASASLAADEFGFTARTIQKYATDGKNGFSWV